MIGLLVLQLWAAAPPDPTAKIFERNRIAVRKIERVRDEPVYTVDLPFDPLQTQDLTRLEPQLAEALGCQDFTLVSSKDKMRIRVAARKSGEACMIKEAIEETR